MVLPPLEVPKVQDDIRLPRILLFLPLLLASRAAAVVLIRAVVVVAAAAVINGVDVIVDVIIIIIARALLCGNPPQNNTQTIERKSERLRRISIRFSKNSHGDKRVRIVRILRMLHLIGLGLGNEKDITVNALEAIRDKCTYVYLENYTSVLASTPAKLEEFYGKKVTICDRAFVESNGVDGMLTLAGKEDVAFLVVGDCFAATTHSDLVLRAHEKKVKVKAYYNASIMNACAGSGLQLYNFGKTVSLCFFTPTWKPDSFYDSIKMNKLNGGLHTLVLLDIRVKEPTVEALCTGKKIYEPARFMSVSTAARQMLYVENEVRKEGVYDEDSIVVATARVGQEDERFISCTLKEMCRVNAGGPLHSLILVGTEVHELEENMLKHYRAKPEDFYSEGEEPESQYLEDGVL